MSSLGFRALLGSVKLCNLWLIGTLDKSALLSKKNASAFYSDCAGEKKMSDRFDLMQSLVRLY